MSSDLPLTPTPSRRSARIARFRAEAQANGCVAILRSPDGRLAMPIIDHEPVWPKTPPTHARERARRLRQRGLR